MIVKDIYDITMALMDEMKDSNINTTPVTDYASTKDYTARTPGILTILQTEVIMELKKVGADVDTLERLTTMNDEVQLEDDICMGVLPYGLAARLLGQEDTALSNYFSSLYRDGLYNATKTSEDKYIAEQIDREDVYNSTMEVGE